MVTTYFTRLAFKFFIILLSRVSFVGCRNETNCLTASSPVKRKLLTTFFFLIIVLSSVFAQTGRQTVILNGGEVKGKQVFVALHNREEGFPKNGKLYIGKTGEVNNEGTATVHFENLPAGVYAIAAFLDENGNGKLDTNIFGIPTEKYGFSNNVRPMMRAATFKEASFTVTNKNNVITIKLK